MLRNRIISIATTVGLIAMFVGILSCGDSDEETKDRLRFTEYIFFPTAPYVDKSYIEEVPEDEVASSDIDYEAEIATIQDVYRTFINAYVEKDMDALSDLFDKAEGIEYGTSTVNIFGWNNIKSYIETNWFGPFGGECTSDPNWELTDFYIRPKNVEVAWTEASAQGPMFYYAQGLPLCYNDVGRFYLTKKDDEWRIHQIDGSKYFTDTKYKVP